MTRQTGSWFALLTVALLSAACTTAAGALAEDVESPRDLAVAAPESVGVSSTRIERLEAGMRQFVEDGRLAGVHTMVARHGKIVSSSLAGVTSVESGAPLTDDAIYLRPDVSRAGRPRLPEQAVAVDDRHPRPDTAVVPTRRALVLQHRGRRIGLSGPEALGTAVR